MNIPPVIVSSLSSSVDSSFATEFVDSYFFPSVAADYCSFMSVAVQATTFLPAAAIEVSSFCPPGVKDFVSLPVAVEECCFLPAAVGLSAAAPAAIKEASIFVPFDKKMVSSLLAGAGGSSPPAVKDTPSPPPAALEECCFLPAAIGLNTTVPAAVKEATVSAPFD